MSSSSFDSVDLPVLGTRTQCVLMARDPHFIFAYWDYTAQDMEHLKKDLGVKQENLKFVLRIDDISAKHTWDIDVGFMARNAYIHVEGDNTDYCVEIGLSKGDNHFVTLVRSNVVRTPPKAASKRDDLIWQEIKFQRESRPFIREDMSLKKDARRRALQKSRTYALTGEDIEAYYRKLFAGGTRPSPTGFTIEDIVKSRWPGVSFEKVNSLINSPDLIRRIHPGASEQWMSQEELAAHGLGASEKQHVSSPGALGGSEERLMKKRKFFFEIWTELIVHGRTEPDAVVWLNSQGVKLNHDGTFSLRYSLPDGTIPLAFIAQSSDGVEQRHIYTRVERAKTLEFPKILKKYEP